MDLPTMSATGGAVLFCLPCILERTTFGPGAPLDGEPERAVTIAEGAGLCLRHLSGWVIGEDTRKSLALIVYSARRAREIELRDQAVNPSDDVLLAVHYPVSSGACAECDQPYPCETRRRLAGS